jgi:hypothetical protein
VSEIRGRTVDKRRAATLPAYPARRLLCVHRLPRRPPLSGDDDGTAGCWSAIVRGIGLSPELMLSLNEWQRAQILTIEPQDIENIEDRFATSGKQFVELADAFAINTDDFSIKNRALDPVFWRETPSDNRTT